MPGNMNINRFLSRKDKDGSTRRRSKSRDKSRDKTDKSSDQKTRPLSGNGITSLFKPDNPDPQKATDKEPEAKMTAIKKRLKDEGYADIEDTQINYALTSMHANGDVDKAFDMLVLFQESVEGIIKPYDPSVKMLGAQNRENVTCYLDALLFAMFARLGSFEPILYKTFDDEPLRRLSTLIRLWVNMLRTGKFIQTDITEHLQEALAACGWEEAAHLEQQDTSEAFSFITEKLELPLLTLKMDIYHTGAEDANDDHKFIQERLLEVAVPDESPTDRGRPIRLEDCLEDYFNNRVEVVRHLDHLERTNTHILERSDTVSSARSGLSISTEKASSQHVEITEVSWSPTAETPSSAYAPSSPLTPGGSGRHRAPSIIRTRVVELKGEEEKSPHDSDAVSTRSPRKGTVLRKEVLMPAWQFFSLIPWVSGIISKSGHPIPGGVAAQFSQTRPVLGICLKRYAMTDKGEPVKKKTFIDIPLDIRLPHFIQDGVIPEDGPMMGSFKLSLQSVICHRGDSVQKGHYISFIRGTSPIADGDSHSARRLSNSNRPPHYAEERWIKFDDLDTEHGRVSYVDIEEAMKKEDPYLLFYQVQPAYDVSPPPFEHNPPSYSDSAIPMQVTNPSPVLKREPQHSLSNGYFDGARDPTPTIRLSAELERPPTPPRRSINLPEDRRGSLAFTETSLASTASSLQAMSAPVTPNEETAAQRMSRAAARFTKSGSKSRPSSASGENRISATFSRLNLMRSKDSLNKVDMSKETVSTNQTLTSADGPPEPRTSITIEETSLKPEEGGIDRSKSKRGRKRGKSKESSEKEDHERNGHHHHRNKSKGKLLKDDSDRECSVM